MSNNPLIYHGEWWVPAELDRNLRKFCFNSEPSEKLVTKYKGDLIYNGDEDTTLELHHYPSNFHAQLFHQNEVMWGQDANGHIFTLFNAAITQRTGKDFTTTKFVIGLVLIGEHVYSGDEARFRKCVVQFPYLRNWAFQNMIKGSEINLDSFYTSTTLLEAKCEEGVCWRLRQYQPVERTIHDLNITHITEFEIEATEPQSIKSYLKQIEAFSQFLSVALFCDQNHTSIKFDNDNPWNEKILLCKKETSINPEFSSLIKFDLLKDKLPSILKEWYDNFEKVAPITSYLIQSLKRKNKFEVPDFLIVAQALDGYYKRFANKKKSDCLKAEVNDHQRKGRDKPSQYENDTNVLLSQFEDVDCIQKCHIDAQILAQSRDKHSHLLLDKEKPLAVEGIDLYWLTEKCKVLLTCCILNMIGLTNEEINLCCKDSPISQIIDSLPPEIN